jgi:hypothetical protein
LFVSVVALSACGAGPWCKDEYRDRIEFDAEDPVLTAVQADGLSEFECAYLCGYEDDLVDDTGETHSWRGYLLCTSSEPNRKNEVTITCTMYSPCK